MEMSDAGGRCGRSVLMEALINLFVVEGGGGGDHAEERGDPFAERLPEGGPAGQGGSEADPDAAGHPEAQRAESQGEGAEQKGEEQTATKPRQPCSWEGRDPASVSRFRLCRRSCSSRKRRSTR